MAYQLFTLDNGVIEVRSTSGIAHLVHHESGEWTVTEDPRVRAFATQGEALDCARDIIGDK